MRDCLRVILNVTLDKEQWTQASLPVKSGVLGIRKAFQIAPSAYLATASGSASLVSSILRLRLNGVPDPYMNQALAAWMALGGSTPPSGASTGV